MVKDLERPDPERLLEQIEEQERRERRGRLKVFLGYASGVGKSFQMLDEGRRRRERGEDVVIAAVQPQYPAEIERLLSKSEVIPPLRFDGKETIDVAAVLRRKPKVALIDGLAYDNPPGSPNAKRWQDVEQLLDAGISVITSVNLHYIQEFQDDVQRITGKRAAQSISRAFLEKADEIAIVDAPADVSLLKARAPAISSEDLLAAEEKLSRLREMALLVAAEVVDQQLESYLRAHGMEQVFGTQERILVCVTPRSNAERMITSGRRNADRFHGELFVVYVKQHIVPRELRQVLEANLEFARKLGAQVEVLSGMNPVEAIVKFAREKGITQIFIGHSLKQGGWRRLWTNFINRLVHSAEGINVSVFPHS